MCIRDRFYVGDSFTAGTIVPKSQSVPDLVEKWLNDNFKSQKYEVINAGTSGYSTVIYNVLIRQFLHQYKPDLVVLNVDMTDNREDFKYKSTTTFDKNGIPIAVLPRSLSKEKYLDTEKGLVKNSWLKYLSVWLSKHSYTYNHFSYKKGIEKKLKEDYPPIWKDWTQHKWDTTIQKNVNFTLNQLTQIIEFCKSKNIELLVTSVPHYGQFSYGGETPKWSLRPHEIIKQRCAELGISYFDSHEFLLPHLKNTEQPDYYFRKDMHFNDKGFALWAKAHQRALELLLKPENSKAFN